LRALSSQNKCFVILLDTGYKFFSHQIFFSSTNDKNGEDATEVLNNIQLKRTISTISAFTMETDNNPH